MQQFYLDLFTKAAGLVCVRGIFDAVRRHWTKVAAGDIPADNDVELRWTPWLAGMPKYGLSKKLKAVGGKATIVRGDIVKQLNGLKHEAGGTSFSCVVLLLCAEVTAHAA